ncbi:zinc knuckle-domain-containing protein [Xylaria digitata]|nr:zinc knuckle-domain-containing protein [Xylaria digitata]
MYRRGPSKSTPANVQCQKCLKRGHYSYECKASAQERPYIPRPSRTQQLLNPKLVPKLASDTTDALQDKKGIADQELAKREVERARKQELEQSDDTDQDVSRRERSPSYDSVSTISTRRSPSVSRRRESLSPIGAIRRPSTTHGSSRRSSDSGSDYERRYSPSPRGHTRGIKSPEPTRPRRSPSRDDSPRRRDFDPEGQPVDRQRMDRRRGDRRRGRYSQSPSRSPPPGIRRRFRSRSPREPWRPDNSPPRYHGRNGQEQRGPPKRDTRERSLSPFSKRLALTQAMNAGR